MELLDSRRLTGPNLVWDSPGALLDVAFSEEHRQVVAYWTSEIRLLLAAAGLPAMGIATKSRKHGAWLVAGGPIDQLYGLIDVSEMAWNLAVAKVLDELGLVHSDIIRFQPLEGIEPSPDSSPDWDEIANRLTTEANPALIALQQAALEHRVSFFWDDDFASVGMGETSKTWPIRALPSPTDIDWAFFGDVPLAVVTGTNGKSTNIRLLSYIADCAGFTNGSTSTDWIRVGQDVLDTGDYSGPGGARTVLRDPRVEIAFLETARGGLLRRGAGVERARVALITNVAEDHMGQYGIHSVEDLVEAKMIVARLVRDGGVLVLNADDPALVKGTASLSGQEICWFSLDYLNEKVVSHVRDGGRACAVKEGAVTYWGSDGPIQVAAVDHIPITLEGKAAYNVSNCLSAAAVALELGIPLAAVQKGLTHFESTPDSNPGRSNYFQVGDIQVLLDYAHNVHGLTAILSTTALLGAKRRILTLSTAGDRTENEIRQLAAEAARFGVEEIIVSDCIGYERELGTGGVPRILQDELHKHGIQSTATHTELDATKIAFERARPGDILILLVKAERSACVDIIRKEAALRSK